MLRWLGILLAIVLLAVGCTYYLAGRQAPPEITINKPSTTVGQRGTLAIDARGARLDTLTATLQQNGRSVRLFSLDAPQAAKVDRSDAGVAIERPFGKESVPELQEGPAQIVVAATRKSFLGLRTLTAQETKDVQVRLQPPRVSVVSTHHYVNHGGAEMVIYRATPADVASGVRVGTVEYTGFPASGAGVANSDPALKVAFFALLHEQTISDRIVAFARDEAGNEATASFVDNVFEKPFKKSRIEIDDRFLQRVVPEILEHAPELKLTAPTEGDLVPAFLKINGDLRRMNADKIAEMTRSGSASRLWNGPFVQLGNSQVEAGFADHRTYLRGGKEIDQQTHLGFDLAVTANVPVLAANSGKVLNASWLGIYGNCVIIDHGMGVASLYGHLSSFDVGVGDTVTKGQIVGKSGMTGLAGGDHLHFTMLVGGHPVNPVEWWDAHWVEDRVDRKLREAGAPLAAGSPAPMKTGR
jgi:murein DD-endopeptidase MepM/ murein hydrolase activator NlpD